MLRHETASLYPACYVHSAKSRGDGAVISSICLSVCIIG